MGVPLGHLGLWPWMDVSSTDLSNPLGKRTKHILGQKHHLSGSSPHLCFGTGTPGCKPKPVPSLLLGAGTSSCPCLLWRMVLPRLLRSSPGKSSGVRKFPLELWEKPLKSIFQSKLRRGGKRWEGTEHFPPGCEMSLTQPLLETLLRLFAAPGEVGSWEIIVGLFNYKKSIANQAVLQHTVKYPLVLSLCLSLSLHTHLLHTKPITLSNLLSTFPLFTPTHNFISC